MFHFIFLNERFTRKVSLVNWSIVKFWTADISNTRFDFSSDSSSRTRRVVTTRQHFTAVSPPALSSQMDNFFLSLSPTDILNSRVEFSSDGLARTKRVVRTCQHFQVSSPPPLSSESNFLLLYFRKNHDPISALKSRPDSIRVYWTTGSLKYRANFISLNVKSQSPA